MVIRLLPSTPLQTTTGSSPNLYLRADQHWKPVRPDFAQKLGDSRRQLHYAAQFATAAGISYLPPRPDDSHTNLEWLADFRGLFSRDIPAARPFRVGVQPSSLSLLIVSTTGDQVAERDLDARTIDDTTRWVRKEIESLGADSSLYTLRRHYEIPPHAVAKGKAFSSSDRESFAELATWFANGFAVLNDLTRETPGSSEVRCWPHHFDIGSLITSRAGRAIGVGLEPGDDFYDEPYFYVNMTPPPEPQRLRSRKLAGSGTWHKTGWIGAVLPGSRLGPATSQGSQVAQFLHSAISIARESISAD
jgi:hypothetical protein